jgi:hypothetical protein
MTWRLRKIFFIPILTIILSACGSSAGFSSEDLKASRAAALTDIALTAEATPIPSETPTESPTVAVSPSLPPTLGPTRTATRPPAVVEPPCDDSAFIVDVTIPDGTKMEPGEEFIKTWSFRNTGTCRWTTEYTLAFVSGNPMDGVATFVPAPVDPGGTIEISVGLVAPSDNGTYTSNWRLKNPDGKFFGDMVYVQIVVTGGSTAATATSEEAPTATPETTAT